MNTTTRWLLIILGLFLLLPLALMAQTNDAAAAAAAAPVAFDLGAFLAGLALKYPKISAAIGLIGALRLVMKPIVEAVHKYVLSTPGTQDDQFVARIERSSTAKFFLFILDWTTSFKVSPFEYAGMKGTKPAEPIRNIPISNAAIALLPLPVMLFSFGCKSPVPGNHISGFLGGQPFEITNPKQTTLKDVSLLVHSGTNSFELKIGTLSSTNDPQVIDKSYAGQAAVAKEFFTGINDLASKLVEGAAKGAK